MAARVLVQATSRSTGKPRDTATWATATVSRSVARAFADRKKKDLGLDCNTTGLPIYCLSAHVTGNCKPRVRCEDILKC